MYVKAFITNVSKCLNPFFLEQHINIVNRVTLQSFWFIFRLQVASSYNAFNIYRRELAPGTVSLTGDRAQGDDSKHWAYSR